jgi:hypothetical protein
MDLNEIDEKLSALDFRRVYRMDHPEETQIITEYAVRNQENFHVLTMLAVHLAQMQKRLEYPQLALIYLMEILYLVEGIVNYLMNLVIFTLILQEHHDLWFEDRHTFVSSFDDLFRVSMFVRETFLEQHGFGFFRELCNRELRNAIAHQNFKIEKNGDVFILKKRKIVKKLTYLHLLSVSNKIATNAGHIMQKIHDPLFE